MLVLETITHETIWGGTKLKPFSKTNSDRIGHLYSLYCREGMSNIILNGIYKGKYLNDVFPQIRETFKMSEYSYFPLTIALVDASDNLSIQVHPNNAAASQIENVAYGKRESWYFLNSPAEGYIYNGCKCSSKQEVQQEIENGKIEEVTDVLKVQSGDYVYVEPGTLHAMTAGCLVYEIEEGSDYTYRFFDFERVDKEENKRELHIEKALQALEVSLKSITQKYQGNSEICEETYATRRLKNSKNYRNNSGALECLTIIEGECVCEDILVNKGMTVILEPSEEITNAHIGEAIIARKI